MATANINIQMLTWARERSGIRCLNLHTSAG